MSFPSPKPGDVIFVYSPSLPSYFSCLVQRFKLTPDNPHGSRFSHVAIALNEKIAFEASPTHDQVPDDAMHVWSGVPHVVIGGKQETRLDPHFQALLEGLAGGEGKVVQHKEPAASNHLAQDQATDKNEADAESKPKWNQGARLILLPDLLIPTKKRAIFRHPHWSQVSPSEFDTASVHIAAMYGSPYSIERLRVSFEEAAPRLASMLPKKAQKAILSKASAPSDDFGRILMEDQKFKASIEEALSIASLTSTFFCSQLVAAMLVHARLLDQRPEIVNITPCGLFDLLKQEGWVDVSDTDYSDQSIDAWRQSDRVDWQTDYYLAVGRAIHFRMYHLVMGALDVGQGTANQVHATLDEIIDRLGKHTDPGRARTN